MRKITYLLMLVVFMPVRAFLFFAAISSALFTATAVPAASFPTSPVLTVQAGHSGKISSLVVSRDGKLLITAGDDRTIKVWDIFTRRLLRTLRGHSGEVTSIAIFADSGRIVSGAEFRWENIPDNASDSDEPPRKAADEQRPWGRPAAMQEEEWLRQTNTVSDNLKIWNIETGRVLTTFECYRRRIEAIALSPDDRFVLAGGTGFPLTLYDTATGKIINKFIGGTDRVRTVAFSPDGAIAASAGEHGNIRFWSVPGGKLLGLSSGHAGDVGSLTFSPDGTRLVSAGNDKTIRIWDSSSFRPINVLSDFKEGFHSIAYSRDGVKIVAAGDSSVSVWNSKTWQEVASINGIGIGTAEFSADGATVFYTEGTMVKAWNYRDGDSVAVTFSNAFYGINKLAVSPGNDLLMLSSYNIAAVWDLKGGSAEIFHQEVLPSYATPVITPDKRYVITTSLDGSQIVRLDHLNSDMPDTFSHRGGIVRELALSFDGRRLVSWSDDNRLEQWDVNSLKKLQNIKQPVQDVSLLRLSRDNSRVLVGSRTNRAWVFDTASGETTADLSGHDGWVISGDFSSDGRSLVTGSQGMFFYQRNKLITWKLEDPQVRKIISGQPGWVSAAVFSSDGREILSGGDRELKRWNADTGKLLATYREHTGNINTAAYAFEDKFIFSTADDGATILWNTRKGAWSAKLFVFTDGTWIVVDPDGRFDTNNLDDIKDLHWVMPDDPLKPLPLEIFMKDYYEPRLLPRILAGEKFKTVRALQDLNRVQPEVKIAKIEPRRDSPDSVSVTVEVTKGKGEYGQEGSKVVKETGVYDLRLFRDGQMVAYSPDKDGEIKVDPKTDKTTIKFKDIKLPRKEGVKQVEFSAYAFNEDRVKSATDRKSYELAGDLTPVKGRAYIITVGVNAYENPSWDLQYAANDAKRLQNVVNDRLGKTKEYEEIVPISLISDYEKKDNNRILTEQSATKADFKVVLDLLSGKSVSDEIIKGVPNADRIRKAGPEDLVLISFSSHGYADNGGNFYFFPYDIGNGSGREITDDLLKHAVSSEELSLWLRDVDAGIMAMIVDACHSAATVEGEGFKPGPMGSRGLGQLAYDKGMRILTASQADDVALESDLIKQGLLTYSLVHDGIEAGQADFRPKDKEITLAEWLEYGVDRVPKLYEEVKAGDIQGFGRGEGSRSNVLYFGDKEKTSLKKKQAFQQPSLFDFSKKKNDVVLIREQ